MIFTIHDSERKNAITLCKGGGDLSQRANKEILVLIQINGEKESAGVYLTKQQLELHINNCNQLLKDFEN